MATTINDFKEMPLSELTWLYKAIFNSCANRKNGHNTPTLDIMREIIIQKLTGQLHQEYLELVEGLGEGDFESENRYPLSTSECVNVFRKQSEYGIEGFEIKEINSQFDQTENFLEERETEEETKEMVSYYMMLERYEYLNDLLFNKKISTQEMKELQTLKSLVKNK